MHTNISNISVCFCGSSMSFSQQYDVITQPTSPTSPTSPTGRRLNMNHGFLKFIVRNQYNRDEFHKIEELRKTKVQEKLRSGSVSSSSSSCSSSSSGSPRPMSFVYEKSYYVPPALRKQKSLNESSSDAYIKSDENAASDISATAVRNTDSEATVSSCDHFADEDERRVREGVRRRHQKKMMPIDDICVSLANSHISNEEKKAEQEIAAQNLFTLKMRLKNDVNVEIDIPRGAQAARIAKELTREHNFNDSQCRRLREFIELQLNKRLNSSSPPPIIDDSEVVLTTSSPI
ncbi:unnamed protein product [Caenorhabditis bovis]|uniref:Uncharacterized protein n=1 Tax=Caenorhabditis bovis TaxID=2654633 RepID=A0A8S1F8B6_9PELO|nr:unnamed protein product [Caenorhabditis bovis]